MSIDDLLRQAEEVKSKNYELSESQKSMVIFAHLYQLPINLRRFNANDH